MDGFEKNVPPLPLLQCLISDAIGGGQGIPPGVDSNASIVKGGRGDRGVASRGYCAILSKKEGVVGIRRGSRGDE